MKLVYRGNEYESDVTGAGVVESGTVGLYRGQTYRFTYPRHIRVPQSTPDLKYRGVTYRRDAKGNVLPVEPPARAQAAPQPSYVTTESSATRKAKLAEAAKVHHETILRHLQHRLDVARQKGDERLIQMLEQEMQQMA